MMRLAQVAKANGPFELVEREVSEPGPNAVRVAVDACGVCHSDVLTKMAAFPGMTLPRVPGHEVIGRVDALGPGVEGWTAGWYSGVSIDSEDTLAFSARTGVRAMNEVMPLAKVSEAYDRMMRGKARFRVVLATGRDR
jgi:D-arabinose 1-dehydrogenase-like Zn-dependent alcohol dehydrogenase